MRSPRDPVAKVPAVQGVDSRTKRADLRYPSRIPLPHMQATFTAPPYVVRNTAEGGDLIVGLKTALPFISFCP